MNLLKPAKKHSEIVARRLSGNKFLESYSDTALSLTYLGCCYFSKNHVEYMVYARYTGNIPHSCIGVVSYPALCRGGGGESGSLMVMSPTASWIRWCMQVYACELMWTCLTWDERSTPDNFWVPSH